MKTKAAILETISSPLAVDEIEIPSLAVGQVLVRVYASGICGAQLNEIAGNKGPDKYLPHLLGHEGGGVVIDVGPGVTHIHKGEHVVIHWRKGRGIDSACPKYKWGDKLIGGGWNTTFQEYSVISENRLTSIADDIPHEIAALMGCAVTTGLGVVFNEAQLKLGQSIAVIGCGGVGLNIIQGATITGAAKIAALDICYEKLNMALDFGTDIRVNIRDHPSDIELIRDFDVIVDTTGCPELIAKAYKLVTPSGKVIMVGQPRRGESLILPDISGDFKGKTLMDSTGGRTSPNEDIPRYLDLYRKRRLRLDELITHRFPLDEINEALDIVRSGIAGRIILEME